MERCFPIGRSCEVDVRTMQKKRLDDVMVAQISRPAQHMVAVWTHPTNNKLYASLFVPSTNCLKKCCLERFRSSWMLLLRKLEWCLLLP